jgi:hypothetical protein
VTSVTNRKVLTCAHAPRQPQGETAREDDKEEEKSDGDSDAELVSEPKSERQSERAPRKVWDDVESQKLRQLVETHGPQNWGIIHSSFSNRTITAVRQRWYEMTKVAGANLETEPEEAPVSANNSKICQHCGESFQYPSWLTRHYAKCPEKPGAASGAKNCFRGIVNCPGGKGVRHNKTCNLQQVPPDAVEGGDGGAAALCPRSNPAPPPAQSSPGPAPPAASTLLNFIPVKFPRKRHPAAQDPRGSSKYRGVSWHKPNQKWQAEIEVSHGR